MLLRPQDGTAAAIFDERQRNISHARMSVSSDAYSSTVGHSMAPQLTTGAMPELLPRGGSRRSIELALGFMRHSTLPVVSNAPVADIPWRP